MTTSMLEREEVLDLSDLDLLDDTHSHLACGDCSPGGPGPAIGLCGKQFFSKGIPVWWDDDISDITCTKCNLLWPFCPRCGK